MPSISTQFSCRINIALYAAHSVQENPIRRIESLTVLIRDVVPVRVVRQVVVDIARILRVRQRAECQAVLGGIGFGQLAGFMAALLMARRAAA
ncbi:hypothetical protein [Aquitalea denitrificans]|uniref:hypothetical protein n=1 Tax=Aquitalea denitrificans TaxID=519081 RepID=UPI00135AC14C|nr:hypothetical protein [Aquitalea denitrificans]